MSNTATRIVEICMAVEAPRYYNFEVEVPDEREQAIVALTDGLNAINYGKEGGVFWPHRDQVAEAEGCLAEYRIVSAECEDLDIYIEDECSPPNKDEQSTWLHAPASQRRDAVVLYCALEALGFAPGANAAQGIQYCTTHAGVRMFLSGDDTGGVSPKCENQERYKDLFALCANIHPGLWAEWDAITGGRYDEPMARKDADDITPYRSAWTLMQNGSAPSD